MPSRQELQRRMKAVANTGTIAKAMEMVAATKMRRSQERALRARPYALEVLRLLAYTQTRTEYVPPIMRQRPIKKTAVVVVSSDRGLAGAFNSNVMRAFEKRILSHTHDKHERVFLAVGKKTEEFLTRRGIVPYAVFKNFGDYVDVNQTQPLAQMLFDGYMNKEWDRVMVIAPHFRSTLKQEVLVRLLLPTDAHRIWETIRDIAPTYGKYSELRHLESRKALAEQMDHFEYLIEPSPKEILDALAPRLLEISVYHIILEANASEHSARMVAMKSAADNASDLSGALSLQYNKARQAAITQEITEIIQGSSQKI
ncbi:MAG: ATP synthase F1 subunit gamma [Candidatus Paceibacterota bacterium]|jgi:F-type H+-transporting ATPase subunit gamma